jgi:hypothetical protein
MENIESIDDQYLAWWHLLTSKMNTIYHQRMVERSIDPSTKDFHAILALRYQEHSKVFGEMDKNHIYDNLMSELRAFTITSIFEHNIEPEANEEELNKAQTNVEIGMGFPLTLN